MDYKFKIGDEVIVNENHPIYGGEVGCVHEVSGEMVWVRFAFLGHITFKSSDLRKKGGRE